MTWPRRAARASPREAGSRFRASHVREDGACLFDLALTALRLTHAPPMTSLLFIAPKNLGETVLALAPFAHVCAANEADEIVVICDDAARPLFRAMARARCAPPSAIAAWGQIVRGVRRPYDVLFDLRRMSSVIAVRAKRRLVLKEPRTLRHLSEDYAEAAGLATLSPSAAPPAIHIDDQARDTARALLGGNGPLLVLSPGDAPVTGQWPAEHFAAVARRLVSGMGSLSGARVVILGDEKDARIARTIALSLDADGVGAIDATGVLDVLAAAALLERATLFIGNDGPLMHVSAAIGAPTLGLFGPSDERVRGPRGIRTAALRARPFADIMADMHAAREPRSWLTDISVDSVEEAATALVRAGGVY